MNKRKADLLFSNSASQWIKSGDKVTKEFFNFTGQNYNRTPVQALMDSNGQLCWEPTSIRNIASSYYEKLLTAEPLSEQVRDCRSHIWAEVRNMV